MAVERPLDLLNQLKNKEVIVVLDNGKEISGILLAFDIHINIALDQARISEDGKGDKTFGQMFIKGGNVCSIS